MPKPRTKSEIEKEIEILERLEPSGDDAKKTKALIFWVMEELSYGVDDTTPEWEEEMTDQERDLVIQAREWAAGNDKRRPAHGWEGLVKEPIDYS